MTLIKLSIYKRNLYWFFLFLFLPFFSSAENIVNEHIIVLNNCTRDRDFDGVSSETYIDSPDCLRAIEYLNKKNSQLYEEIFQIENSFNPEKEQKFLLILWSLVYHYKSLGRDSVDKNIDMLVEKLKFLIDSFRGKNLSKNGENEIILAFYYLKNNLEIEDKDPSFLKLNLNEIYNTVINDNLNTSLQGKNDAIIWLAGNIIFNDFESVNDVANHKTNFYQEVMSLSDINQLNKFPLEAYRMAFVEIINRRTPLIPSIFNFASQRTMSKNDFLFEIYQNEFLKDFIFGINGKMQAKDWTTINPIRTSYANKEKECKAYNSTAAVLTYSFDTLKEYNKYKDLKSINPKAYVDAYCRGTHEDGDWQTATLDYYVSGDYELDFCDLKQRPCFPWIQILNSEVISINVSQYDKSGKKIFSRNLLKEESLNLNRNEGKIKISFNDRNGCRHSGKAENGSVIKKNFMITYDSIFAFVADTHIPWDISLLIGRRKPLESFDLEKNPRSLAKFLLDNFVLLENFSTEVEFLHSLIILEYLLNREGKNMSSIERETVNYVMNFLVSLTNTVKRVELEERFKAIGDEIHTLAIQADEIKSILDKTTLENNSFVVVELFLHEREKIKTVLMDLIKSYPEVDSKELQAMLEFYEQFETKDKILNLHSAFTKLKKKKNQLLKERFRLAISLGILKNSSLRDKKILIRKNPGYFLKSIKSVYKDLGAR